MAVNHRVRGSSPRWGAIMTKPGSLMEGARLLFFGKEYLLYFNRNLIRKGKSDV